MKLSAIATAIVMTGIAGVAMAGNAAQTTQPRTLRPVTVSQAVSECSRPDQASSHACDVLYRLVDANFTPRELKTVLTWETTHPQYLFDQIEELHDRYAAVLQGYVAARQPADAHEVAVR